MSALLEHRAVFAMPPSVVKPDERMHTLPRQPLVRTGRLTLRRPNEGDAEAIAAVLCNYDVAKMLIRVPQPYHLEDARDWLASLPEDAGGDWFFAIVPGGVRSVLDRRMAIANGAIDSQPIGFVSVEWRGLGDRAGWHIGYWLAQAHWGKGIMTEAVNAVAARFFLFQMGETLGSDVMTDNRASLRLQRKLGFDITGVDEAYSMARSQTVRLITTELTFGGYMPM